MRLMDTAVAHPFPFEHPAGNREWPGGEQYEFHFANGYGASVIRHSGSFGHESGLWELAVLKAPGWDLCFTTPVTSDVIGYLDEAEVAQHLDAICRLP